MVELLVDIDLRRGRPVPGPLGVHFRGQPQRRLGGPAGRAACVGYGYGCMLKGVGRNKFRAVV